MKDHGSETQKLTINIGYVDLGRIDLLVQDGFFSNRSEFIRTAIRHELTNHAGAITRTVDRHTLEMGLRDYSLADLESVREARQRLCIKVVGLARIAADVSPALALETIASITVLGALQASSEVKDALADRISYRTPTLTGFGDEPPAF